MVVTLAHHTVLICSQCPIIVKLLLQAGIVEGIVVMILVAVISVKAMMMIIDCKYHIELELLEPSRKAKPKVTEVKLPSGDITGDLKVPLLEDTDAEPSKDIIKKQVYEVLTYGDIGRYLGRRTDLLALSSFA